MQVDAIDISRWNWSRSIDFDRVFASGVKGVVAKATEGASWRDPMFANAAREVLKRGKRFGAYHFITKAQTPAKQVAHFISTVNAVVPQNLRGGLFLAMDWEDYGANEATPAQAEEFLRLLDEEAKRLCWVYGGNTLREGIRGVQTFWGAHPLWHCQYPKTPSATTKLNVQASWKGRGPDMWQYSATGRVAGIAGVVDLNEWRGRENFDDLWAGVSATGTKLPPPPPVAPAPSDFDWATEFQLREIQKVLDKAGFALGPSGVDGLWGSYTNDAINSWLKAHDVEWQVRWKISKDDAERLLELMKRARGNFIRRLFGKGG